MSDIILNATQTAAASAPTEWLTTEWRYFFRAQSLICLITSLSWMLNPALSLTPFRNSKRREPDAGELAGLQLGGISLFAFAYFLARVIWTNDHPFRTSILYFQEAASLACVLIILCCLYLAIKTRLQFSRGLIFLHNFLAISSLALIVGFLYQQGHVDNSFFVPDFVHTSEPEWLDLKWLYYYRGKSILCMITAITWLLNPASSVAAYAHEVQRGHQSGIAVSFQLGGISLFSFAFFLARLTWTTYQPDRNSLLHFQEAATTSDIMIMLSSLYIIFSKRFRYNTTLMAVQVGFTAVYMVVGISFLFAQSHIRVPATLAVIVTTSFAFIIRKWLLRSLKKKLQ